MRLRTAKISQLMSVGEREAESLRTMYQISRRKNNRIGFN